MGSAALAAKRFHPAGTACERYSLAGFRANRPYIFPSDSYRFSTVFAEAAIALIGLASSLRTATVTNVPSECGCSTPQVWRFRWPMTGSSCFTCPAITA
jgi:hypothetical protein